MKDHPPYSFLSVNWKKRKARFVSVNACRSSSVCSWVA
jgi:hypothetical protein